MKKSLSILLILVVMLFAVPVHAKENNFYADENVSVEGNQDGSVFAAGYIVKSESVIDGLGFFAGNKVTIKSTQDHLFAAGYDVVLNGIKTKDAFVAGNTIEIEDSSIRDLYAAASIITINSDLSGDLYASGESVTINGVIDGDVNIAAEKITISEKTVINGTLKYNDDAEINIDDKATINDKVTYESKSVDTEVEESFGSKVVSKILSYISILLVSFVLILVNKNMFVRMKKLDKNAKLALNLLYGFVVLIVVPIACILAMFTIVGIPLSIITLLLYGILIYLSIIPTAYILGDCILGKKITNDYALMSVSLLILYVIKLIPVLGGLVSFASLIFGLGTYWKLLVNRKN